MRRSSIPHPTPNPQCGVRGAGYVTVSGVVAVTEAVVGAGSARRFRARLLRWFARHGRDLPWRRTRDPYAVLVSEVMLQQTQVSRVAEFYPRFLARFPSVEALARARPKAVREAWDGLGYYARATNLHALARVVSRERNGELPSDPDDLVRLPGVGRYTASAVAAFAYEQPVAAVDTNVARVVRRVFQDSGEWGVARDGARRNRGPHRREPLPTPLSQRKIWELAAALVPKNGKTAWRFNQALMELGALVCRPRKPRCPECPVRGHCRTGRRAVTVERRTQPVH